MRTRLDPVPRDKLIQYHRLYPLLCDRAGKFLLADPGKPAELKFERFILLTQEPRGGTAPSAEMDVNTWP